MKKALITFGILLAVAGLLALTGTLETLLFPLVEARIGRLPTANTSNTLRMLGWFCLFFSLGIGLFTWLVPPRMPHIRNYLTRADQKIMETLQRLFGRYISFEGKVDTVSRPTGFSWRDGLILVAFALFSALFFLSFIQTDYPYVKLSSDGATIASFAAAYDHPQMFVGDPVLGDRNRFGIYQALIIPLIRFLVPFTNSYPLAYLWVMLPTVFLFLSSFYLLGREFFQDRYWAVLFTVLNAIPYYIEIDSTGIRDPLPRVIFQSVFPLVIFLLLKWKDRPNLWFIVSTATGLLVYIHSVSTPAWAAGILLGYLVLLPRDWGIGRKLGHLILQGICVLLVMLPFILNFSNYRPKSANVDLAVVNYIYANHFPRGLLDVRGSLETFLSIVHKNGLLYFFLASIVILFFLGKDNRRTLGMVLLWGVGISIISILLPYSERIVERYLRLPPIEIELLRGIRHFIFLMLFVTVWALSELAHQARVVYIKYGVIVTGLLLLALVFAGRDPRVPGIQPAVDCLARGRLICGTPGDIDGVLLFLRDQTPPGARVFFANRADDRVALVVRYIALRPLVYSHKDRGVISTDPAFGVEWYKQYKEFSSHGEAAKWYLSDPKGLIRFAKGLGAEYLVLNLPDAALPGDGMTQAVYRNKAYTIFFLDNTPVE